MLTYVYQNGNGTNQYSPFVPEGDEAQEMEKVGSKQYGTIDVETNVKNQERASEFSPGNPFAKQKVQIRLRIQILFLLPH